MSFVSVATSFHFDGTNTNVAKYRTIVATYVVRTNYHSPHPLLAKDRKKAIALHTYFHFILFYFFVVTLIYRFEHSPVQLALARTIKKVIKIVFFLALPTSDLIVIQQDVLIKSHSLHFFSSESASRKIQLFRIPGL